MPCAPLNKNIDLGKNLPSKQGETNDSKLIIMQDGLLVMKWKEIRQWGTPMTTQKFPLDYNRLDSQVTIKRPNKNVFSPYEEVLSCVCIFFKYRHNMIKNISEKANVDPRGIVLYCHFLLPINTIDF